MESVIAETKSQDFLRIRVGIGNPEYKNDLFDWIGTDKMILLTAHRRENLGEPMKNIFRAVDRITKEYDDVKIYKYV